MNMHKSEPEILAGRLAGAAWGHLVGDAIGVPYEFKDPGDITSVEFGARGTHHQPAGTWSDDGALMLALLDSLLDAGFDPEDQGRRALDWQRSGAYTPDGDGSFDIGGTTARALSRLAKGSAAIDAGPADEHACGNGSLMRILPLALVGRNWSPAQLIGRAHDASRVTHGHVRCQVACAVYCVTVVGLLRGERPAQALEWALAEAQRAYADDDPGRREALDELRAYPDRRGSGFVTDAFWSAWDAFAGASDYADTIRRAIRYGNDTDTTAAIAGGLAGAYWGWDGIPVAWRRGMRGREVVTPLVDALVEATGARTSTSSPLRVDDLRLTELPLLSDVQGRAGITFLPGKKLDGWTGLHWRDLDADAARLRALGVDVLFLLNEDVELARCAVPELRGGLPGGPELIRYPIQDPRTPTDLASYRLAVQDLLARVRAGQSVAIACRGGIDRSGMTAACLLREAGLDTGAAIAWVQAHRRGSITIGEQQGVVRDWVPA